MASAKITKAQQRAATRRAVLDAAVRVIRRHGVAGLTLEAVAQEAGVSKGGLLYHFAAKNALITATAADLMQRFDAEVERWMAADPRPAPGRWLRAFVRATFEWTQEHDLTAGLLAAAAENPALLVPQQEAFARYQRQAEADGLDPALATVIRLAADGLWFADAFGMAPPEGPLRARTLAALIRMTSSER